MAKAPADRSFTQLLFSGHLSSLNKDEMLQKFELKQYSFQLILPRITFLNIVIFRLFLPCCLPHLFYYYLQVDKCNH